VKRCRCSDGEDGSEQGKEFSVSDLVIIGSGGQLGWELVRQSGGRKMDFHALDFPEIDITDPASVKARLEPAGARVVVNAAAYTAVDRAESEPKTAFAVNREGPAHLAAFCAAHGAALVHISTDYVFNGLKKGAYRESDPTAPLGVYGRSKADGEEEVRRRLERHVIIRTAWLYGVYGPNFVKTMVRLAREQESLRVVADQRGCPTFAADLAEAVLEICRRVLNDERDLWGTYHYCGAGAASWHEFATAAIDTARRHEPLQVKRIEAITTEQYPTPARRPPNSVLDCGRMGERLGIRPRPWRESLADMIARLYTEGPR
jgi:dTDP-4-dehydrorhamnose reductase